MVSLLVFQFVRSLGPRARRDLLFFISVLCDEALDHLAEHRVLH